MTMLINKPNRVQVLLSYSEERKQEMRESHEKNCQALVDKIRDVIEIEAGGKITKISSLRKGFADLLIEGRVPDGERLQRLQEAMKRINKDIGAEKLYLFAKPE